MTNQEILEKLLEAERLVIRALRIMHEVRVAVTESSNAPDLIRKDQSAAFSLITHLFRVIEPHHIEDADKIDIDVAKSDWAPRGEWGIFRLRYEVLCGLRRWDGFPRGKYPKV